MSRTNNPNLNNTNADTQVEVNVRYTEFNNINNGGVIDDANPRARLYLSENGEARLTQGNFLMQQAGQLYDFKKGEWTTLGKKLIENEKEEIEFKSKEPTYDLNKFDLMNFDCDQRNSVHFIYTLPFKKNRMLVETTWFSKYDKKLFDYQKQIDQWLWDWMRLKKTDYKIKYKEQGAIPLFPIFQKNKKNFINIGTAGGMTRVSTGYTFLNIQEHSKYIRMNIDNINEVNRFKIKKKYYFFDKIFMKVLDRYPEIMPKLFYNLFGIFNNSVIKFLSNKSNFIDDIVVIFKMPKWIFIKSLFN